MTEWTLEDEKELRRVEADLKKQAFWSKHAEKIICGLYVLACAGLVLLVHQTFAQ